MRRLPPGFRKSAEELFRFGLVGMEKRAIPTLPLMPKMPKVPAAPKVPMQKPKAALPVMTAKPNKPVGVR